LNGSVLLLFGPSLDDHWGGWVFFVSFVLLFFFGFLQD